MRQNNKYVFNKTILQVIVVGCILLSACVYSQPITQANSRQVLKGEAIGKVLLGGEPYGTGKVIFYNAGGDASFTVTCDNITADGMPNAHCIGTDVNGWFSGGPNGYATFGTGKDMITLQLVDGKKFTYAQGGATAEFEITDPSIFNNWDSSEEENQYEPEEYDPEAPLTDSGAKPADIDGQVEIACPPNFDEWEVLKHTTVIYNHCRLKTGEESSLRISFSDTTTFVMRPETEVVINEATKEKSNFQLLFGGIWTNVKKMANGEEILFEGSQAVAGIKGTTFVMEEKDDISTLKVIEGTVNLQSKVNAESMDVEGGKNIIATKDGLGTLQDFDRESENNYWDGLSGRNDTLETDKKKNFNYVYIGGVGILIVAIMASILFAFKKRKTGTN